VEHLRFFTVHYEADKEHGKAGHRVIDHLLTEGRKNRR